MNTYLEKLYEQLGENHSVVYLNYGSTIFGWLIKEEGALKLYCNTLYSEEVTEDTAQEVHSYLNSAPVVQRCASKDQLYKTIKESVMIQVQKQDENEINNYKEHFGKYFKLYSGTYAVLVGVSSTDEDYYNMFLTTELKVVYSSSVGLSKEIKELPESPLKELIKEGKLEEYTHNLVKKVNDDFNCTDYVFLSI